MVATDRVSAYDVVLKHGIAGKGIYLTLITSWWLCYLSKTMPDLHTHWLTNSLPSILDPLPSSLKDPLKYRSMQVKSLDMFPIESIVRGYLTAEAWDEYQVSGTVGGIPLPPGLVNGQKLPMPLWTPSWKAQKPGEEDQDISQKQARALLRQKYDVATGNKFAKEVQELSFQIFEVASKHAEEVGLILVDTKFEFGNDGGKVVLGDEVLTPDSSRFWDKDAYDKSHGKQQIGFDKQYLRDWLSENGLKGKKGVAIPEEVAAKTAEKYREVCERITGLPMP